MLAQHLRGSKHEIGGRDAFGQAPGELEADDFGNEHGDGLAEHCRLGLDAAHAPAEHAQAVDHGGVAIGTDASVGIGDLDAVRVDAGPDGLGDVLQIDLMADAGARRHGVEIGEALRSPFEEIVALHVAVIFDLDILLECLGMAEFVDHDRVVDDQIDRHERIDLAGVAAELGDGVAHRGQIDHAGHAGEILQQHARRSILDLAAGFGRVLLPVDQRLDVGDRDCEAAILEAQQIFEQDLHREWQSRDVAQLLRCLGERIIVVIPRPDLQRVARPQRVLSDRRHLLSLLIICGAATGSGGPDGAVHGLPCAAGPARSVSARSRERASCSQVHCHVPDSALAHGF